MRWLGCSRPAPVEVAPVEAAPVALAPPVAELPAAPVAPMPRAISDDPHGRPSPNSFRASTDPVLRGLARREIKAGDLIEPLIKLHPNYAVLKQGDYTFLDLEDGYGRTFLAAKNGKLVSGRKSSCTFSVVFFDDMTEQERNDCWEAYTAAIKAKIDRFAPPPREAGAKP